MDASAFIPVYVGSAVLVMYDASVTWDEKWMLLSHYEFTTRIFIYCSWYCSCRLLQMPNVSLFHCSSLLFTLMHKDRLLSSSISMVQLRMAVTVRVLYLPKQKEKGTGLSTA